MRWTGVRAGGVCLASIAIKGASCVQGQRQRLSLSLPMRKLTVAGWVSVVVVALLGVVAVVLVVVNVVLIHQVIDTGRRDSTNHRKPVGVRLRRAQVASRDRHHREFWHGRPG